MVSAFWKQTGGGTSAEGASIIEAPSAEGGGCGEGVPLTTGVRVWGGLCHLPRKIFYFWSSKSLVLLHFECYFCKFVYDGLHYIT